MFLRRTNFGWEACARAKLNLYLEVLGRRPDGFHELETLVVPVQLYDTLAWQTLSATAAGRPAEIQLEVRQPRMRGSEVHIPPDEENLVVRALRRLQRRAGCELGARVVLTKRIPAQAGLGGGSSDAAAALHLANRAWGLEYGSELLAEIGADVGSDVPALLSSTATICRGRGERVVAVDGLPRLACVVVQPEVGLATADVFARWGAQSATASKPSPTTGVAVLVDLLKQGRSAEAARKMTNSLQPVAEALAPVIRSLRRTLERLDVLGHQMSGSGSAYFGICRSARHARRVANLLRQQRLGVVYATMCC